MVAWSGWVIPPPVALPPVFQPPAARRSSDLAAPPVLSSSTPSLHSIRLNDPSRFATFHLPSIGVFSQPPPVSPAPVYPPPVGVSCWKHFGNTRCCKVAQRLRRRRRQQRRRRRRQRRRRRRRQRQRRWQWAMAAAAAAIIVLGRPVCVPARPRASLPTTLRAHVGPARASHRPLRSRARARRTTLPPTRGEGGAIAESHMRSPG